MAEAISLQTLQEENFSFSVSAVLLVVPARGVLRHPNRPVMSVPRSVDRPGS